MGIFKKEKSNYFFDQFALVGSYSLKAMDKLKSDTEAEIQKLKDANAQLEKEKEDIKRKIDDEVAALNREIEELREAVMVLKKK